jgi:hypothetical protein
VVVVLKEDATVLAAQVDAAFFTLDVEIYGYGLLIDITPLDIFL